MISLVFVDADNTLWDTDNVYRKAQEWLLGAVEQRVGRSADVNNRLTFVRTVDQELAYRHHAGLRYPTRLLCRALALVLDGESAERAVELVWSQPQAGLRDTTAAELEAEFDTQLGAIPALRPMAAEALELLHREGMAVVVLTEGSRRRVLRTLISHGIDRWVSKVVEAKKDVRLFRRARRLRDSGDAYMIGDQLDRDIAPAKEAGLTTIYFPGGFTPRWAPDVERIGPDYTVADLWDAADIILKRSARPKTTALGRDSGSGPVPEQGESCDQLTRCRGRADYF